MARRRKSSTTLATTSSYHSTTQNRTETFDLSRSDSESVSIGEEEYPINYILDETRAKYIIDWEGPYSPTWEPKECANVAAIEAWEESKRRKGADQPKRRGRLYRGKRRESSSSASNLAHRTVSPHQTSAEAEVSATLSLSPLFVPYEAVPETQSTKDTQNTIEGETDEVIPGASVLESTEASTGSESSFEPGSSSSTTPSTNRTSSVEDSPLPSFETGSQSLGGSGNSIIYPTQSSHGSTGFVTQTSAPGTLSKSTDSSCPQIIGTSQGSDRYNFISQPTQLSVDEVAETPSILRTLPPHIETPSFQAGRSVLSQISSIPETDFRSNQNSHISQSTSETFDHSQAASSVHVLNTQNSSIERNTSLFAQSLSDSPVIQFSGGIRRSPISGRNSSIFSNFFYSGSRSNIMDNEAVNNNPPSMADAMEKYSHVPGSTPREKMMNAHAQLRANINPGPLQSVSASATPSSAGDIEAAAVSVPETTFPLSVRVDKEPAAHTVPTDIHHPPVEGFEASTLLEYNENPVMQTIQPSALTVSPAEEAPPGSVQLGPSEFAITLPMDSRVKDDYERVLTDESHIIRKFHALFTSEPSVGKNEREQIISQMREVIEKLENITVHPDLNIAEHIKDSATDPEKEAAWAEYSSSKFQLLGYFVQIAQSHDLHIIIMVQQGKTVEIVERYLLGKGFEYTRPRSEMGGGTNIEISMINGSLSFGVRSAQSDGVVETYKRPSAIIALDTSFNAKSPSIEHLRTTYARHENLLPVVRLLVSNTSEHIERCLPNLSELQRLRLLAHYIYRLHDAVGDLQDDALGVPEDAEELLSYLLSDNFNASWTWPTIEPLQILSPAEIASALGPEAVDPSTEYLPTTTSVQKRFFEGEEVDEPTSKRQRISASQDTSQLTNSTKAPSQTLDNDLKSLERSLIQMKNAHAVELNRLQTTLSEAQSSLAQKFTELAQLQHRYETRTKDLHKTRQERDTLIETTAKSEQRLEKQRDEIAKLKDERTQLKHDLEAAREALKNGGGTEADLEAAGEEIRRLSKENASLEKKADYEKKQSDYAREQYQNASTAAAQSGIEIRQLKEENEELKRKVAVNATSLKEMKMNNDESRHLARLAELEATLASRDDLLRRKEEELRELKKNRPSTRSTSTQPRSPKWAAANSRPTSPGLNNSSLAGRGSALRFSSEMST